MDLVSATMGIVSGPAIFNLLNSESNGRTRNTQNPFLNAMLAQESDNIWEYDWAISLSFFIALGIISALFAIRNIRRAVP
jgi:hypothetical protein